MTSPALLISNDDGPESPLLPFFLKSLKRTFAKSELRVAIPATEQSWIANAVTRFRGVTVNESRVGSQRVKLIGGTPADCASIGIFNLWEAKPDFLFSGINMGSNAGVPYFYSSGTVGAALGGYLAQTKSAAISVGLPPEVFQVWIKRKDKALSKFNKQFQKLADVSARVLHCLVRQNAWRYADLYSINLPWEVVTDKSSPRICFTSLEPAHYTALFEKRGKAYFHHHQGLYPAQYAAEKAKKIPLKGDLSALREGLISITPIHLRSISASLPTEFMRELPKLFERA